MASTYLQYGPVELRCSLMVQYDGMVNLTPIKIQYILLQNCEF